MEVRNILDTVSKLRNNLKERRAQREYSRSISPINVALFKEAGNPVGSIEIPATRGELLNKFMGNSKTRGEKAYKIDAAELIEATLVKFLKKVFAEIKFCKRKAERKPPICKTARVRAERSFHDLPDNKKASLALKTKREKHSAISLLTSSLKNLFFSVKFRVFSGLKKNFRLSKGLSKVRQVVRSYYSKNVPIFKVFISLSFKKVLLPVPAKAPGKVLHKYSYSSQNTIYVPGKIVKNCNKSILFEKSNFEEPEKNPTFGRDTEDSLLFEELKAKNSIRNIEIKQRINELEKSNEKERIELNRSKRSSISSVKGKSNESFVSLDRSFISQSANKGPLKPSPFVMSHQSKGSDTVEATNEEELDLKSFIQNSFEKDCSFLRIKENESFETKLTENQNKDLKKFESPLSSSKTTHRETPASLKRKRLMRRLEGLGKLEDRLFLRFYGLFTDVVRGISMVRREGSLSKLEKILVRVLKKQFTTVINARPLRVYIKCLKGMISCFNCNLLVCKENAIRKWQMKARFKKMRNKELYLGISSLFEVIKKHIFTKNYFVLTLMKKIVKKQEIKEFSLCILKKNIESILSRLVLSRKRLAFKQISVFLNKNLAVLLYVFLRRYWRLWKNRCKIKSFLFKRSKKSLFLTWKKATSDYLVYKKIFISNLTQIIQKKYFPVLWTTWKSLKNPLKLSSKLQQRAILKKYIEIWLSFQNSSSYYWIESFYQWRKIINQEKMNKLKDYKSLFL